jgi:hypothetical protein
MAEDEEVEYEDEEPEGDYILIFDETDVRANGWTAAMVFAELFKNLFACFATFFNAWSILAERKSDHKENQRVLHDAVTADLESLPVTEE